jgi:hypothetical protein
MFSPSSDINEDVSPTVPSDDASISQTLFMQLQERPAYAATKKTKDQITADKPLKTAALIQL